MLSIYLCYTCTLILVSHYCCFCEMSIIGILLIMMHVLLHCCLFQTMKSSIYIVSFKAKGSIYQSFAYTVRSFCLEADDMYCYRCIGSFYRLSLFWQLKKEYYHHENLPFLSICVVTWHLCVLRYLVSKMGATLALW